MKKTIPAEETSFDFQAFFDEGNLAENKITIVKTASVQQKIAPESDNYLDNSLTAVKWLFLYFPGAAAVHFVIMGFTLSFFYGDWFIELFLGILGIFSVAVFMIMFGIGKLSDLKYLKVVLGIFLTSSLAAITYIILVAFISGDFFGVFTAITLFLPILAGHLIKGKIDVEKPDGLEF